MKHLSSPVALVGLLLCLAFSTHAINIGCVTSGCSVYTDYKFAGLSFYHWGALFFAVALMLTRAPFLLMFVAIIALVGDAGFLAYQLLYWPCTNCLIVATIVGLFAFCVVINANVGLLMNRSFKAVFCVWAFLFFAVSANAGKELISAPWVVSSFTEEARTQVFFSPTCPSCQEMVESLLYSRDAKQIAFIPIAKSVEDMQRLAAMPDKPLRRDIKLLFGEKAKKDEISLDLRINLMRNQAALASHGATVVPYIVGDLIPERGYTSGSTGRTTYSYQPQERTSKTGSCNVFKPGCKEKH